MRTDGARRGRGIRRGSSRGLCSTVWPDAGTTRTVRQLEDELIEGIDRAFVTCATEAGKWLCCGPGCDACCHGPFPITRLDVERLRRGLQELSARDPARADAVRRRALDAVAELEPGFPGDTRTGRLGDDVTRLDAFFDRHTTMACPALDPRSGMCELYGARPISCRTFGPPMNFGGATSPPCELCFRGAAPETLERCCLEPDPDGIELRLLARLGVPAGQEWETLIAFALARS